MPILVLCLLLLVPTVASAYAPAFDASLDGSLDAAPGGPPLEVKGTPAFVPGRYGQAVALGPGTAVFYAAKGALDKSQGTLSLWVRPNWNGDDGLNHALLADQSDYFNKAQNTLYLWKDTRGLLRFDLRTPLGPDLNTDVRHWRAGEWRHVAATWSAAGGLALYVDGLCVARRHTPYEPMGWPRLVLGGDFTGSGTADAAFDEVRIFAQALHAAHVLSLRDNLPLEDAGVAGLTAPKTLTLGEPFEVAVKVLAASRLTRDYPVVFELGGIEVARVSVATSANQWPAGKPVDLTPFAITVPDYARPRPGPATLTARLDGAVAPADLAPAEAKVSVISPVPQSPGHVYSVTSDGIPLRDKRPLIPTGANEGFLYDGQFYRDDAAGRAMARRLMETGDIQDAFPCRLLDAVRAPAVDHDFVEYGQSLVNEVLPGVPCRLTGAPESVTQKVTVNGQERAAAPGFSYTLKAAAVPVPHVLVAELPDDRARVTEIALDAAAGSALAPHLAATGPGDTRLVSLCTVYTGGDAPTSGQLIRKAILFYPKSSACTVTITSRAGPAESAAAGAVAGLAVYQLLDSGAGLHNQPDLPEEEPRRSVTLLLPEHGFLFSQYGFAGATDLQRRASLLNACDYLKLMGVDRLEFEPLAFGMSAYYDGSRLVNQGSYDLFDELLAIAEEQGLQLVPLLDAMSYYDQLPEFSADSFQLDRDGKTVRQSFGKVPDPLRPEVQAQMAGLLSEFLERVRGKTCVPFVAFRADGVAGSCYSGDAPNRPPEEAGYSEWDLQAFEAGTGVKVGGTAGDTPSRYAWLRANPEAWERWIAWRCEQTKAFWLKCRDLVVSRGDGRKLLVRTSLPSTTPGQLNYWQEAKTPPLDVLRHHGYDPRMYSGEKGLRLSRCLTVGADRYTGNPADKAYLYDAAFDGAYQTAEGSEVELRFHDWATPDHPRGYRVGPAAPAGRTLFEPLVHALRVGNPHNLTLTNWYPATLGNEFALRRFIRAFRALPALEGQEFAGDVFPRRDTLVVKRFGLTRMAVINDSPQPQRVRLTFAEALPFGSHVTDLATGRELSQTTGRSKTRVELTVEAWGLVALEVKELPASGDTKPRPGQPGR